MAAPPPGSLPPENALARAVDPCELTRKVTGRACEGSWYVWGGGVSARRAGGRGQVDAGRA